MQTNTPTQPHITENTVEGRFTTFTIDAHASCELGSAFFFTLVINGTISVRHGADTFTLGKRDLLVLTPSMSVTLTPQHCDSCAHCIRLEPDYFDSLYDGMPAYNQLVRFFSAKALPIRHLDEPHYHYLLQTMALFTDRLQTYSLNTEGLVRHLCSFFLLQVANVFHQSAASNDPVYIKRSNEIYRNFKRLAIEHYRTQHQLAFYADCLHISTTYLSRLVRQVTGRTVHTILADLRYAEARRLLESTDMDAKEIAAELGFADQSAFSKFFSKRSGLSPQQFRQRKA